MLISDNTLHDNTDKFEYKIVMICNEILLKTKHDNEILFNIKHKIFIDKISIKNISL